MQNYAYGTIWLKLLARFFMIFLGFYNLWLKAAVFYNGTLMKCFKQTIMMAATASIDAIKYCCQQRD